MSVWFVRSNGDTDHNQPGTPGYVPGEPPEFPTTAFDYHDKCLSEGFARLGWPNTGDLRKPGARRLCKHSYALEDLKTHEQRYMRDFSQILTGDLMLIPANAGIHEVHLGLVVRRVRGQVDGMWGRPAYYYRHDVSAGEFYECAHRVEVLWDRRNGAPAVYTVEGLGGIWRSAFSRVKKVRKEVEQLGRRLERMTTSG